MLLTIAFQGWQKINPGDTTWHQNEQVECICQNLITFSYGYPDYYLYFCPKIPYLKYKFQGKFLDLESDFE